MTALNAHCDVARDARGVVTLTIVNAGSLTIFGTPVIEAVCAGLATLAKDTTIRALVIRGGTEKAFVGGADIKELATLTPQTAEIFIAKLRDACEAVRNFPAPAIARIPGWCLGGGLEFAIACDFRIASDASHFGMPEVKVGIPSVIHAAMLPRLIGGARARWFLLTGVNIDAATALAWGLVDAVVPADRLDAEVETLLGQLLECGPEALKIQKDLLRQWEELPLKEAIAVTIPALGRAFRTDEPQRYMAPFLNRKRAARD
jgi:enoyl-CoA hydratase/carnithine racemase